MSASRTLMCLILAAGALVARPSAQQSAEGTEPARRAKGTDATMSTVKPESVGMSSQRLARIHDYIQGYMDRGEIAGAVTLVARHGRIVHFEAQGFRSKEDQAPMQTDTIFSLMSMTKPIVSTALMMLWEEGRFLLDDPIAKWLPNYADKKVKEHDQLTAAKPVTIRHVLTHTSGLSMTGNDGPAVENALATPEQRDAAAQQQRQRVAQAPPRPKTLQEAIDRAAAIPLNFQPGTQWQYGASTDYVAVLVEKMTGMTIDQFTRARIFQPLGMVDTHYNIPRDKVGRVAAVYRPDDQGRITLLRKPEYREPTTYFPGIAGMNGTALDYFRYAQMLLNGGELNGTRLLGRMTVNQMFTNHVGTDKLVYVRGEGWGFGLGAGVLLDPAKALDAMSPGTWSWGGADGTLFYIDPREDVVALLMVQLNPYAKSQIRPKFSNVVAQAVVDSSADRPSRVLGYQPLR